MQVRVWIMAKPAPPGIGLLARLVSPKIERRPWRQE